MKAYTLRKVAGFVNAIIGFIFVALSGLAVFGSYKEFDDRIAEPEDFYGLIGLFALCILLAIPMIKIGRLMAGGCDFEWRTNPILWSAGMFTIFVLGVLASLDVFGPDDPGIFGMRILLVPMITMVVAYVLRKSDQ